MLKKPHNIFLIIIFILAFLIRIYRIDELLGFYYDQGRDALVINDLIEKGKWFLIGPTTGIAGIFRGPFYYYLITPFYFIGNGNPVFPAIFLIFTSVFALFFVYRISGIWGLILSTFSYELIYASRWLSNPTPMLLLSMILIWSLLKIYRGNKKYWILTGLTLGLSLFQFGSSGEIFYFPAIAILLILDKKIRPSKKIFLQSSVVFIITLSPLFIFDLRHGGILSQNIFNFLTGGGSTEVTTADFFINRISQVLTYFINLLFHELNAVNKLAALFLAIVAFISRKYIFKKNLLLKIISVFLLSCAVGFTFFLGNSGTIYGYYLTGYYLIFMVFVGIILKIIFTQSLFGKIFVIAFVTIFLTQNFFWTKKMLTTSIGDNRVIVLGNELQAISWIYSDSGSKKFNVDVYVPPVIPYAYDYLFLWIDNPNKLSENVSRLYTLYEADPEHPERLNAWLVRQAGIGKIIKEEKFGGVTVQERERY